MSVSVIHGDTVAEAEPFNPRASWPKLLDGVRGLT
jgi:hypothetical protein